MNALIYSIYLIYSKGKEADDIVMSFRLITEEAKQYNVVKASLKLISW